jgi:hypothetical protein
MTRADVLLVAIHPVRDFATWERMLTDQLLQMDAHGVVGHRLFRSVDDPNEVMVALELESKEHAEALMQDGEQLRAWLDRAGVEVYPSVFIGEEVVPSDADA